MAKLYTRPGRRPARRSRPKRRAGRTLVTMLPLIVGGATAAAMVWWLFFRKEEVVQTPQRLIGPPISANGQQIVGDVV